MRRVNSFHPFYWIRGHLTIQVECGDYRVLIRVPVGEDFGPFDYASVPYRDVNVVDPTLSPVVLEGKGFSAQVQHVMCINEPLRVQQVLSCSSCAIPSIL